MKKKTLKKIVLFGGLGYLVLMGFSLSNMVNGIRGMLEFLIFLAVIGVIYQMFFAKKTVKQYDPREYETPDYNKDNYISNPKEADSYTPPAPTGHPKPFSETPASASAPDQSEDKDKSLLGHSVDLKQEFFISDEELNGMCLLLGSTGTGKTTTVKTILDNPLKNNNPIIIVDGKGSPSFYQDIKIMCAKYNRNFKLFHIWSSEQIADTKEKLGIEIPQSFHYSSLRHGGFTELKDKIISIYDWTEEHYKLQAERFLQGVFKFLLMPEVKELLQVKTIDFKILSQCLSVDVLTSMVENIGESADFLRVILNEVEESAAKGLANRINALCESEISDLFIDTQDPQVIDLMQSIENNDVVFFSLDSLKFSEYSKLLGRLIIADLKTVSPRFYGAGKKIYTVFDEFNVFASEIIVNLINKTREYGFRNIMGTQELADMLINGDRKLLNQILGNTNVKICMRQDVHSSCEELANSVNTQDKFKTTVNFGGDNSTGELIGQAASNKYSASLEEEFIYKPREFSQLGRGEAIIFTKFPEFRHAKIKIRRV